MHNTQMLAIEIQRKEKKRKEKKRKEKKKKRKKKGGKQGKLSSELHPPTLYSVILIAA